MIGEWTAGEGARGGDGDAATVRFHLLRPAEVLLRVLRVLVWVVVALALLGDVLDLIERTGSGRGVVPFWSGLGYDIYPIASLVTVGVAVVALVVGLLWRFWGSPGSAEPSESRRRSRLA